MKKPITIRGVTYPSQQAAAKAIGVTHCHISKRKLAGLPLDDIGLRAAKMKEVAPGQPIKVRRRTFSDVTSCAAHFGITVKQVRIMVMAGRADMIGLHSSKTRVRSGRAPIPVRIRGKVYPSARRAAEALGLHKKTVEKAINEGREDRAGLGRLPGPRKNGRHKPHAGSRPVQIGNLSWPTLRDAATALGVTRQVLASHLNRDDTEWLVARAMAAEARKWAQAADAERRARHAENRKITRMAQAQL